MEKNLNVITNNFKELPNNILTFGNEQPINELV